MVPQSLCTNQNHSGMVVAQGLAPRCLFETPRGSGNCQNKFVPLSRRASNYPSTSKQSANYRGSNRGIVQLWDLRHSAIRASLVEANTAT